MYRPSLEQWGLIAYEEAWRKQKDIQQMMIAGTHPGVVVFCEHPPTVTAGSSTQDSSFILTPEQLAAHEISFYKVERGGDLTLHRPGQLVCYPLLNLNSLRRDVHWYMRALEGAIMSTCEHFGVLSERITGRTGVWIVFHEGDTVAVPARRDGVRSVQPERNKLGRRKIASIGVRLSRWCSMHGLALNVLRPSLLADGKDLNSVLVPCGLQDAAVTSLEEERETQGASTVVGLAEVRKTLAKALESELGFEFSSSSQDF